MIIICDHIGAGCDDEPISTQMAPHSNMGHHGKPDPKPKRLMGRPHQHASLQFREDKNNKKKKKQFQDLNQILVLIRGFLYERQEVSCVCVFFSLN